MPLGDLKKPYHLRKFEESTQKSYPKKTSEFYNEVNAFVRAYGERLENTKPTFRTEIWEIRMDEVDTLRRELGGDALDSFNDVKLEKLCRAIATQNYSYWFGRTELPATLAQILLRVDKGNLSINLAGSVSYQVMLAQCYQAQCALDQVNQQNVELLEKNLNLQTDMALMKAEQTQREKNIKEKLRKEVREELKEKLREELKEELREQLKEELRQQIRQELKQEFDEFKKQFKQEMMKEYQQKKDEVKDAKKYADFSDVHVGSSPEKEPSEWQPPQHK